MFAWVGSIITKLPGFRPKVTPKKELVVRNPNMTFSCFIKKIISVYKKIQLWCKSWDLPIWSSSGNEKCIQNKTILDIKC